MARGISLILGILALARPVFGGELAHEKWNPFIYEPVKGFFNLSLTPNVALFDGYFLLHLGAVDLKQDAGTPVYSVRKGIPTWPKLREGMPKLEGWTTTVQILSDDGILTYFMHLDPESIPTSLVADIRAKRPVEAGTFLGTLCKHKRLDSHVHFGAADCRRHLRINPQPFVDYKDTTAPTISAISLHRPKDRTELTGVIGGDVELTLYAYDTIDGLTPNYPLHRLELEIASKTRGKFFSSTVFDTSSLPARAKAVEDNTCEYFSDYDGYEPGLGRSIYRGKISGDSRLGQPLALTANKQSIPEELQKWFQPFPGPWETAKVPNGEYTVRVKAFDAKGNSSVGERTVKIEN